VSRFRFVCDHRDAYGVKRLCRVVGSSRSGFYDWCRRPPSAHWHRDRHLAVLIGEIHSRSRRTYGAPRVHAELARLGERCSRRRVARLMREAGRVGAHARRRWRARRPDTAPAPDLVRRAFRPAGPDQVWAADITQLRTAEAGCTWPG
jgi:transposase InsO family protein